MQAPIVDPRTPKQVADPAEEPPTAPVRTGPLPRLQCPLTPGEIVKKLDHAARRGRMAGFQPEPSPDLFSVEAFAAPFEHKLIATPATQGSLSTCLTFRTKALPKMPCIYAALVACSIWPGVWLTHSMIVSWFPAWYSNKEWVTWAWYIPVLVLPLFWLIPKQWKKSRADAHTDALAQIGKLAQELNAAPAQPPPVE